MKSSDYKKEARKDLKGKWLRCVGITIIYFLIIFILGYIQGILPLRLEFLISILSIIIGIPLAFGLIASFFNIYNNKRTNVFDFISLGFSHFGKAWSIFFHTLLKMIVPIIMIFCSLIIIAIALSSFICLSPCNSMKSSNIFSI